MILFFLVSPERSVSINPDVINAKLSDSVLLNCSSRGGPNNQYQWTHVSTGVIVGNESQLSLHLISVNQFGQYKCVASNNAGSDNDTSLLNGKWLIKTFTFTIIRFIVC